jgi:hypothetical protein
VGEILCYVSGTGLQKLTEVKFERSGAAASGPPLLFWATVVRWLSPWNRPLARCF